MAGINAEVMIIFRLILVLFLLLLPIGGVVLAATTADVTLYATPAGVTGGITNFTIIYVSDTRLDFTWGYTGNATGIMIRGDYNGYPDDIPNIYTTPSDGYLVYTGNATTASDTSVNFDNNPGPVYYSAWAQRPDGTWYMNPETGEEESAIMLLLVLVGIPLAFVVMALVFKHGLLYFAASAAWIIAGIYARTRSTVDWDIYYALFILFCFLGLAFSLYPAIVRTKKSEDKGDVVLSDIEQTEKYNDELWGASRIPRIGRRGYASRKRSSR